MLPVWSSHWWHLPIWSPDSPKHLLPLLALVFLTLCRGVKCNPWCAQISLQKGNQSSWKAGRELGLLQVCALPGLFYRKAKQTVGIC